MSRSPSNPLHHGWHSYDEPPSPPPQSTPTPGMGKNLRAQNPTERRERALTKWATTTTALTADERALLREMREVSPDAARRSLHALRDAKRKKENGS